MSGFPFLTVIGSALGLGGSLFSGAQQQSAAKEANELAQKQARQQFRRAKQEYRINNLQEKANFLYETARIEAQRYVERQKESDYNFRSRQLIDSAIKNLSVNTAALKDRFETEEALRAKQVTLDYGFTQDRLAAESGEAVRQYMQNIRDTALASNQMVNETERQGQELITTLVFEQQKDNLERELAEVASMIDQGNTAATVEARLGGSQSAQRVVANRAQELGRTWAALDWSSKQRQNRIALFNQGVQGETAVQLGRMALQMQDSAQKIQFTNQRYQADSRFESAKLKELTIPSFSLAERQYGRELQALQIQTQGVIDEASLPYRKAIFFDPIKPIKGLKPTFFAPTKVFEPSTAGIVGQGILSGIQQGISFGSYTTKDGGIAFR